MTRKRVVVAGGDAERVSFVARYLAGQGCAVVAVQGDEMAQARRLGADYVLRPGARWLAIE